MTVHETHTYTPGPWSRALAFPHAVSTDSGYDDPAVTSDGGASGSLEGGSKTRSSECGD